MLDTSDSSVLRVNALLTGLRQEKEKEYARTYHDPRAARRRP